MRTSALLIFLMLSSIALIKTSPVSGTSGDNTSVVEKQIKAYESALNINKATLFAQSSADFQSRVGGLRASFTSIFDTWSFQNTSHGLTVQWKNINVVFSVVNKDGTTRNFVVSLDPGMTKVTKSDYQLPTNNEQHSGTVPSGIIPLCNSPSPRLPQPQNFCGPPPCSSLSGPSVNWAGFEIAGSNSCSWRTVPVYEAKATWTVPAVFQPSPGACFNRWCGISVWPGLVSYLDGNTGLMQAGTFSGMYTSPNQLYYYGWYETPSMTNSVYCLWGPMWAGDTVSVDIVNEARDGGDPTLYNMFIVDLTINQACSIPPNQSSNWSGGGMGTPYFADFNLERPTLCSGGVCSAIRLPQFSTFSMSGSMYFNGASQSISGPISNGWYKHYDMVNNGWQNTGVGYDTTAHAISFSWYTSNGT